MIIKLLALALSAIHLSNSSPNFSITKVIDIDHVPSQAFITLDKDDLPIIAFHNYTSDELKLLRCHDETCNNFTLTKVDDANFVKNYPIILDDNDYPVLSYDAILSYGQWGYPEEWSLRVARCHDSACTNRTLTTINGARGYYTSIELDENSYPVVSYSYDLSLARCHDLVCTSYTITRIGSDTAYDISLKLDKNSYPVISYYEPESDYLKLARCHDLTCVNYTITTVHQEVWAGRDSSLQLDTQDNPMIGYKSYIYQSGKLRLAYCYDLICSNRSLIVIDNGGGSQRNVGSSSKLLLDKNGFPIMSYFDGYYYDLRLAQCHDPICSSVSITVIDSEGNTGQQGSIALDNNDRPVIIYTDFSKYQIKLARPLPTSHPTSNTNSPTKSPSNHSSTSIPNISSTVTSTTNRPTTESTTEFYLMPTASPNNQPKSPPSEPVDTTTDHNKHKNGKTAAILVFSIGGVIGCLYGSFWLIKKRKSKKNASKLSSVSSAQDFERKITEGDIALPKGTSGQGDLSLEELSTQNSIVLPAVKTNAVPTQEFQEKEGEGEGQIIEPLPKALGITNKLSTWLETLGLDSYYEKIERVGGFENNLNLFLASSLSEIDDLCKQVSMKLGEKNKLKIAFKEAKDVL